MQFIVASVVVAICRKLKRTSTKRFLRVAATAVQWAAIAYFAVVLLAMHEEVQRLAAFKSAHTVGAMAVEARMTIDKAREYARSWGWDLSEDQSDPQRLNSRRIVPYLTLLGESWVDLDLEFENGVAVRYYVTFGTAHF